MAIYHLEAKVISRGVGRSAVAAAAYMSCSQITNEYDGIQHDYTRKQGLVWQQVFLPEYAPTEWSDRAVLWNAVEENEKTKDSRLAREFVVALPIEMDKDGWITMLTEFIQENFVSDGMCADVAIHVTDGHNPHAHIMLTVRPLDEQGKWQYKTQKEYLCIRDGEEMGFTADEFKVARLDDWEKQYQYQVGRKKEYMAPSAAQEQDLERASKTPKSTRFGRQNPIAARWNSDEQLVLWRKAWADTVNQHLERIGADARIDHRSHAARGLLEQPTVHEDVAARAMERQGLIADRCELNRQIKADNAFLRELRKQVEKIAKAIMDTIPAIARGLESLRQKMVMYRYQIIHFRSAKWQASADLSEVRPVLKRFDELTALIRTKTGEHKALTKEKKQTPVWSLLKRNDLTKQIAQLTEELEELRSEKTQILARFDYTEDREVQQVRAWVKMKEKNINDLRFKENQCEEDFQAAQSEFTVLSEKAKDYAPQNLWPHRLTIRKELAQETAEKLKTHFSGSFSQGRLRLAEEDVRMCLEDDELSLKQFTREKQSEEREKRDSQTRKWNMGDR